MKKMFIIATIFCIAACQNNTPPAPVLPSPAPAPVKEKKTITKMPSAEVSRKFAIDIEPDLIYSGYYEAMVSPNQEILNGKFEIESNKKSEDLMANEMGVMAATYTGNYENGIKEGVFVREVGYYEAEDKATITFRQGKCVESTGEIIEMGYCASFKGKLANCTFAEI